MPQHARTRPVCRECDGFATATITTGTRTDDGTRDIVRVHCPACRGLGRTVSIVLVRIGR
ncbi:hypothetical protein OHB36_10615 [Streptomyces sp. NBC_00320]|uniref:hypothetical protein n=1 Tax=Streptomyces sp. NBC_00320 TaxID=2975711 RepID=UPI002257F7D4|nr:hypothetical protein [Streptomyces sp. NBC_00320]MCX5147223.1 hypothetical protein [Streptomyces sp. NBC_00320]